VGEVLVGHHQGAEVPWEESGVVDNHIDPDSLQEEDPLKDLQPLPILLQNKLQIMVNIKVVLVRIMEQA